jgi:hypothetical protein
VTPLVPLLLIVVVGAVALVVAYRWRERQRERWRGVAARHGLELDLSSRRPPDLGFDLFDRGRSRAMTAMLWRSGEQDSVFQYRYTERSGDRSRTYRCTAAMVALPFRAPHLVISTENWWSRMKRVIGLRDVEVESPAFNERYQVRCDDERFAITLLDPTMIAWMLSERSGDGAVTFELRERWLLCHGDALEPELLPQMLSWAQAVREQFPAVLTDLYGS